MFLDVITLLREVENDKKGHTHNIQKLSHSFDVWLQCQVTDP